RMLDAIPHVIATARGIGNRFALSAPHAVGPGSFRAGGRLDGLGRLAARPRPRLRRAIGVRGVADPTLDARGLGAHLREDHVARDALALPTGGVEMTADAQLLGGGLDLRGRAPSLLSPAHAVVFLARKFVLE